MVPLFAVVGRQRGGRCETLTGMTVQRAGELSDDLSCVLHRPQNWPSGSRCQLDQFWAESETVSLSLTHLACCKDVTASPSNPSSQHRVYPLPRCTKKGQSANIFLTQWIEKEHEHPVYQFVLVWTWFCALSTPGRLALPQFPRLKHRDQFSRRGMHLFQIISSGCRRVKRKPRPVN